MGHIAATINSRVERGGLMRADWRYRADLNTRWLTVSEMRTLLETV